MTFLQERYKFLLALLLVFVAFFSRAQTTEWIVLNDTDGAMRADAIAADLEGNTYVFGEFQNDAQFNSLDTTKLSVTAFARNKEAYLAKYNNQGDLEFVHFVSGSGQSIVPGPLTVLKDGRIAALFTSQSGYELDLAGEKIQGAGRMSSVLCIFNQSGELDKKVDVPLSYCHLLAENWQGDLYMMGRGSASRAQARTQYIAVLDYGASEVRTLTQSHENFVRATFYQDQIWLLTFERKETKYKRSSGTYHVSTIDTYGNNEMQSKFDKERGLTSISNIDFVISGGELQLRVLFGSTGTGTLPFDGGVEVEKGNSPMLVYNRYGKKMARTTSSVFHDFALVNGTDDGGYLVTTICFDTLKVAGVEPTLYQRQEPYTGEMIHIKFDHNLKVEWIQKAGGNTMNFGRVCAITVEGNYFYSGMRMNGTAELDTGEFEPNWSSAVYVRKVLMP